jgi:hypothetical protein
VTLALTIISQHGIWTSSDNRLFNLMTKQPEPDGSTKQWVMKVSEDTVLTVTYAGIGRLSNGDHVADLMVRCLRGQSRNFVDTVLAIRGFANERLARTAWENRLSHRFIVGGLVNGKPVAGVIGNQEVVHLGYPYHDIRLRKSFESDFGDVSEKGVVMWAGQGELVSETDRQKMMRAAANRPTDPKNYMELLAYVTRRTSRVNRNLVSASSHVVYVPIPGARPQGPVHDHKAYEFDGDQVPPDSMPALLVFGMDIGSMLREMMAQMNRTRGIPSSPQLPDSLALVGITLEPGVPVIHNTTGARGSVEKDPAPGGGGNNEVLIRWDGPPSRTEVLNKNEFEVLYPDHPALKKP